MKNIITFFSEMIPFVLLLLFILYPCNFVLLSNTILGKIIAIIITAFYVIQDVLSGVLIGLIFLCFYQTDMVSNICKSERFDILPLPMMIPEENGPAPASELFTDFDSEQEGMGNATSYPMMGNATSYPMMGNAISYPMMGNATSYPMMGNAISYPMMGNAISYPGITPYQNINTPIGSASSINARNRIKIQPESETVFKNQHCSKDLEFTYNNQIITHPETIQMIYKDLVFLDGKVCNPCDPTCSFSTSRNPPPVQEIKERLGHTTKGNSLEETIAWATSWMVNKQDPFIGIGGTNNASYI
jgi:hypothetical protein